MTSAEFLSDTSRERLPVEKQVRVGRLWVIPKTDFKPETWKEKRGNVGQIEVFNPFFGKSTASTTLDLISRGMVVARIGELVFGDEAYCPDLSCSIVPSISQTSIDARIADMIPSWLKYSPLEDHLEICRQVELACQNFGVNGLTDRTAELLVYLQRYGWKKVF